MLLLLLYSFNIIAQSDSGGNKKKADKWFKDREWLRDKDVHESVNEYEYDQFGRVLSAIPPDTNVTKVIYRRMEQLEPHKSINKEEFAKQYNAHKLWWDKAFSFLEKTNLDSLKPGKYLIDSNNVFATITEAPSKDFDNSKWESHKKYADIHYVIRGKEKIGITSVSLATITKEYNPERDLVNYSAKGKFYTETPNNFFIIFPQDVHQANIKIEGYNIVKKVFIKIRIGDF